MFCAEVLGNLWMFGGFLKMFGGFLAPGEKAFKLLTYRKVAVPQYTLKGNDIHGCCRSKSLNVIYLFFSLINT